VQVLLKLIQPYTRVRIPFISQRLNIPEKDVEALLVTLILDNRVAGHIDQVWHLACAYVLCGTWHGNRAVFRRFAKDDRTQWLLLWISCCWLTWVMGCSSMSCTLRSQMWLKRWERLFRLIRLQELLRVQIQDNFSDSRQCIADHVMCRWTSCWKWGTRTKAPGNTRRWTSGPPNWRAYTRLCRTRCSNAMFRLALNWCRIGTHNQSWITKALWD